MKPKKLSCVDCGSIHCDTRKSKYPLFCQTTELPEAEKEWLMAEYAKPENQRVMQQAACVEYEGYGHLTRVAETIEFAKKMGVHKIGIATCAGLIRESRMLARILRSHGFEVYGTACKAGAIPKHEVGIDPVCEKIGPSMCNLIFQARQLEREQTELNVVVGLCVGHDSLFYRYSHTLTTTIVVKDRVTGHNPAAVLYTSESYYEKIYGEEE